MNNCRVEQFAEGFECNNRGNFPDRDEPGHQASSGKAGFEMGHCLNMKR